MLYREEQKMLSAWWILAPISAVVGLFWWIFLRQFVFGQPQGGDPAPDWLLLVLFFLFGIGLPIFFVKLRLVIEVAKDHVDVRFEPLTRRKIAFSEIARTEARSYRPVVEYGGWGVKGWSRSKMSYSVRGNQGVELHLHHGGSIMLGTQQAKKLARVLEAAIQRNGGKTL